MELLKGKKYIIWYRGGGYSGCFWEPNAIYWDGEKLSPLLCSGRAGLFGKHASPKRSEDEIIAYLGTEDFEEDVIGVYDSDRKESIKRMFADIREDFVTKACEILELDIPCSRCGQFFPAEEALFEGYRGDGGVGIIHEGVVCSECHSLGSCPDCGEYFGEDELVDGYCEWCTKKKIKNLSDEDADRLEHIDLDLERVDSDVSRLCALKPGSAEKYKKQGEAVKASLQDERRILIHG